MNRATRDHEGGPGGAIRRAVAMACFIALPQLSAAAGESWIEVKAPGGNLAVVTDAGERSGRKTALQLSQFDRALQKRFPWMRSDGPPLMVFVSLDEPTVRSMASDSAEADRDNALSSYLVGPSQHVGALKADLPEPSDRERSPSRGFYRGRASALIERGLGKSAAWLTRGLAMFLADSVVREKEVLVGRMTAASGEVPSLPALTAAEFFRAGRGADRRFDVQAGLFVHYLLLGEGSRNAPALDALLQRVAAREGPVDGQPEMARVTALYAGFPKYLASRKFSSLKLPADPSLGAAALGVRPLPLAEALMLRAEVLFDLNRPVDVRTLLRQVKAADPKLVRPLEIEAVLYEREQRTSESKQAIEAAIQLGSKNSGLHYRLAQLQWSRAMAKPTLQSVRKLLETAGDLSPGDPNTLAYLAEIEGDLGLAQPALDHAQRGARAASADAYHQMALARAQWNARQIDAALTTARKALALAKVASQKQRVQDFLAFAAKNKRAQAGGAKPYLAQFGPPPPGAFGATRSAGAAPGTGVDVGQARTDSTDASDIAECFVKRDDTACARAVPALESACADKQATSCVSLGSLYDGGFGVTRDRRKAAASYKTACDLGDKPGCARLAVLEAQGLGIPRNMAHATKTLDALCGEKIPEACIGLAQILQRTGLAADRGRARSLLKSACDGGTAEACALITTR